MEPLVWGAAALSVVFVYSLGRSMFGRVPHAVLAAAFFATMPLLVDALQPPRALLLALPFILGWLIAVERDSRSPQAMWLAGAGATLGFGLFSHEAAVVTMPALLALTLVVFVSLRGVERRDLVLLAGFTLAALPFVVFLILHPTYISDHVRQRGLYDVQRFSILQGLREMSSWVGLTARSETYWDYFDPGLLFLSRHNIREAFRHPDVFFVAFVICLPVGLYRLVTGRPTVTNWLVVGAFVLAPLAPVLTAERPVARHLLLIAPPAALIAAQGSIGLVQSQRAWSRALGYLTLGAIAINAMWFLAAVLTR